MFVDVLSALTKPVNNMTLTAKTKHFFQKKKTSYVKSSVAVLLNSPCAHLCMTSRRCFDCLMFLYVYRYGRPKWSPEISDECVMKCARYFVHTSALETQGCPKLATSLPENILSFFDEFRGGGVCQVLRHFGHHLGRPFHHVGNHFGPRVTHGYRRFKSRAWWQEQRYVHKFRAHSGKAATSACW